MPYIFPDRVPRSNDTIDKDLLTNDFGDIAEYAVTELGEHNFKEAVSSNIADSSLYKVALLGPVYAPTGNLGGFGAPPHTKPPTNTPGWHANAKLIPNTNTWEVVDSITTFEADGPELLHLMGFVNYGWTGFDGNGKHNHMHISVGSANDQPYETPHIIFALRVNGTIYNKTGHRNPNFKPYLPVQADGEQQDVLLPPVPGTTLLKNYGDWPGLISLKSRSVSHPGYALFNVGFDVLVPVPAGEVLVEIVALRLNKFKRSKFSEGDVIAANSRCLAAVRYFTDPVRSRRTAPIAYTPVEAGNTLEAATLKTNNLDPIKNKLNSLTEPDVGKLNRYHMPAMLHENGASNLMASSIGDNWAFGDLVVKNSCPGENVSTFAALNNFTTVSTWAMLEKSSGGNPEFLLKPPTGTITANSDQGVIIVTGRILIDEIRIASQNGLWVNPTDTSNNIGTNTEHHMACVGLYYLQGSTRTLIPASVVPVCRRSTPDPIDTANDFATGNLPGRQDVTLMAVIDTRSSLLGAAIDGFGICVSVINTKDTAVVGATITQAYLSYEFYKE